MKHAGKIIRNVLSGLVAALLITVLVLQLMGWGMFTVLTASMDPACPPGSLVLVRPVAGDELEVGDIVTYRTVSSDSAVVTHRVVELDAAGGQVITQGDNNNVADPNPVPYANLVGRLVLCIPLLGYLPTFLRSGGFLIALVLVLAILFFRLLFSHPDGDKANNTGVK